MDQAGRVIGFMNQTFKGFFFPVEDIHSTILGAHPQYAIAVLENGSDIIIADGMRITGIIHILGKQSFFPVEGI